MQTAQQCRHFSLSISHTVSLGCSFLAQIKIIVVAIFNIILLSIFAYTQSLITVSDLYVILVTMKLTWASIIVFCFFSTCKLQERRLSVPKLLILTHMYWISLKSLFLTRVCASWRMGSTRLIVWRKPCALLLSAWTKLFSCNSLLKFSTVMFSSWRKETTRFAAFFLCPTITVYIVVQWMFM